jgi:N-acylmannosamine kinase
MVSGGALTALNPATLPIENGFPLLHRIEEATGLKPILVNDAHAAAGGSIGSERAAASAISCS